MAREIEAPIDVCHVAYYIVNDTFSSSICIRYQPHVISVAALCLAMRLCMRGYVVCAYISLFINVCLIIYCYTYITYREEKAQDMTQHIPVGTVKGSLLPQTNQSHESSTHNTNTSIRKTGNSFIVPYVSQCLVNHDL